MIWNMPRLAAITIMMQAINIDNPVVKRSKRRNSEFMRHRHPPCGHS